MQAIVPYWPSGALDRCSRPLPVLRPADDRLRRAHGIPGRRTGRFTRHDSRDAPSRPLNSSSARSRQSWLACGLPGAVMVDGRQLLASGGADGSVRIWDPQTGEQHAVLVVNGHQG